MPSPSIGESDVEDERGLPRPWFRVEVRVITALRKAVKYWPHTVDKLATRLTDTDCNTPDKSWPNVDDNPMDAVLAIPVKSWFTADDRVMAALRVSLNPAEKMADSVGLSDIEMA